MTRFITPALAILILIAVSGVYAYVYLDITASAATVAAAEEEISSNASRDAYSKSAEDFLAHTTTERAEAATYITERDDTASAIELVEAAGREVKVHAAVSSATLVSLDKKYHEELDVTVSATGLFTALARFVTVLELLPRASYVKTVHLEAADKGWYGTYTVAFVKVAAPKERAPASTAPAETP